MAKTIQIVVDVESDSVQFATDKTLTLTQQVRLLKQELQKVPEGTKEWTLLQQKYNETKDSLDRVNVKSKELFGTMSSLPGPIGQVSGQLDNTIGTLKTFSSLKFTDVKTQFVELGKDITGIGKNLLEVTGITKLYTTLNNALAASFVKIGVGEAAAAAGARAFSAALVGTGIGALVVAAGLLAEKLADIASGFFNAGEAAKKGYEKANELIVQGEKLRKNIYEKDVAIIKARGGTEQEVHERTLKFIEAEIETQKARRKIIFESRMAEVDDVNTLTDFGNKKVKEINERYDKEEIERQQKLDDLKTLQIKTLSDNIVKNNKGIAEQQKKLDDAEKARLEKIKQQRIADLKEINDNEKEAILSLLPEREAELQKITDDYKAKIALATKYGQDTSLLEVAWREALGEKKAEYAAEDYKAFEEQLEKDLKAIEDANKAKLDAESIAAELKYSQGKQSEEEYQAELYQIRLKYATSEQERQQAEIDFLEFAKGKQKEYEDTVKSANQALAQSYIDLASSIGNSFTEISRIFEQGSDLQKTFAIIGILINAAASIGKIRTSTAEAVADFSKTIATGTATVASGVALLSNPITAIIGAAQVAAGKAAIATGTAGIATAKTASTVQQVGVGISAAAQIAAVTSAGKSKSAASASAGGGSGAAATPTFNGTVSVPAPVIGASEANPSGNLGVTIAGAVAEGNSRSRPLQAYVIGNQITTNQQLDRRISVAARMGG